MRLRCGLPGRVSIVIHGLSRTVPCELSIRSRSSGAVCGSPPLVADHCPEVRVDSGRYGCSLSETASEGTPGLGSLSATAEKLRLPSGLKKNWYGRLSS